MRTRHRPRAAERPEGHRAVPGHARPGRVAPTRTTRGGPLRRSAPRRISACSGRCAALWPALMSLRLSRSPVPRLAVAQRAPRVRRCASPAPRVHARRALRLHARSARPPRLPAPACAACARPVTAAWRAHGASRRAGHAHARRAPSGRCSPDGPGGARQVAADIGRARPAERRAPKPCTRGTIAANRAQRRPQTRHDERKRKRGPGRSRDPAHSLSGSAVADARVGVVVAVLEDADGRLGRVAVLVERDRTREAVVVDLLAFGEEG